MSGAAGVHGGALGELSVKFGDSWAELIHGLAQSWKLHLPLRKGMPRICYGNI